MWGVVLKSRGRTLNIIAKPGKSSRGGNPYNYLLYSHMERMGCNVWEGVSFKTLRSANIFHIHWPEAFLNSESFLGSFVRSIKLFLTVFLVKIFRPKLVWTVHTVNPH